VFTATFPLLLEVHRTQAISQHRVILAGESKKRSLEDAMPTEFLLEAQEWLAQEMVTGLNGSMPEEATPPPHPLPTSDLTLPPKTATVLQNLHYACVLCWYIGLIHSSNAVRAGLNAPESVRSYGKAQRECPGCHHIEGGGDAQQHTCERCCIIRLRQSQVIRRHLKLPHSPSAWEWRDQR